MLPLKANMLGSFILYRSMMNVDLIIFDCDGVLIDSKILSNRAEVELLKSFGIEFDLGDYMAQFVGKSTKDVLKTIEALHNVSLQQNFGDWQKHKFSQLSKQNSNQFQVFLS